MGKCIALLISILLIATASGKTVTVDDDGAADCRSIQDAINRSWHGDTVIVKPGTYRERIAFNGRRITVRSEDPDNPAIVQSTVISNGPGGSVIFDFAESSESVLMGLTVTGSGIVCRAASPTISKNVIRNCNSVGIEGQNNAAPTIVGNQIASNTLEGVYSCDGTIQGNTISNNSAGIAMCKGRIVNNVISNNGDAGGIYSCEGEIAYNRIIGNYTATSGGGIYGCAGDVHNNVIAGNLAGKDGGGVYDCTKAVYNNTIAGNRAGNVGGGLSRCPGAVYNNIIAFNEASAGGGLHGPSGNAYNDFWQNVGGNFGAGVNPGAGDILTDPLFVSAGYWDTKGTAGKSDDLWVDGDWHLKSEAGRWDPQSRQWVADNTTSHCIDAGKPTSTWTAELWPHGKRINMGAYGGTAEASWSPSDLGQLADLDHNERVDARDLKRLTESWLVKQDLRAADLDRNGAVNLRDFATLARDWSMTSRVPTPPIPSPMTWSVKPYATGPYSVAMAATTATSTDGTGVEYYFEDFFSPQYNSGWLYFEPGQEPRWEDTGLLPRTLYWYHVKARNRGNRLETQWSERLSDMTLQADSMAPTPNPMTWQTQPYGVSAGIIRMVATTATDASGVEYQFECTSHAIYSSGWRDSPTYDVTGVPRGHYKFRVRARDKSPNHNATFWSAEVAVDFQPPTPDPMAWDTAPKEINVGGGSFDYYATMIAVEAKDDSTTTGVEYFFGCTSEPGFNSGWQSSREYTVKIGRKGQRQRFRVKARDTSPSHNETAWSPELPAL